MEELLNGELPAVQQLISEYYTPKDWNELPEFVQRRHLQMSRNYVNFPAGFEVNPMPKPEFMNGKKLIEKLDVLGTNNSSNIETVSETKVTRRKRRSAPSEKRNPKRNVPVINYYEEEEPKNDRYIFCDTCQTDYVDFCTKCGMLLTLRSNPVPMGTADRAAKTAPREVLEVKPSRIHGLGVFALRDIRRGVRMGPYEGLITKVNTTKGYAWKLRNGHLIDASDESTSNYLRYVNCATNASEQNVVAFQYKENLYYRTSRDILKGEELLVYYGSSFAKILGIDPKKYFKPVTEENQVEYFLCTFCDVGLSTRKFKEIHEKYCKFHPSRVHKTYENSKIFKCKHCEAGLLSEEYLVSHEKRCLKNKEVIQRKISVINEYENNKCDYCKFSTKWKSRLLEHVKMIHKKDAETFSCKFCTFKTHYKRNLNFHINTKHEENIRFICTDCDRRFYKKPNLDCHILKCHFENINSITSKIHFCDLCSYKTMNFTDLTRHMFVHKKDKQNLYFCSNCKYSSNRKSNLKQHSLLHSGEYPFICKDCKKGFRTKLNLDSHILNRHRNNETLVQSITSKLHSCNICAYQAVITTELKQHLKKHLNKANF